MILLECCINKQSHTVAEIYLIDRYYIRIQIKLDKVGEANYKHVLFSLHYYRCIIPFFSTHSGLWQKDQCIKYITVCCNLGEKCAYSPVHLCWKGWFSTWKLTTPICSMKVYFSEKQNKWHIYCHSLCDRSWIPL